MTTADQISELIHASFPVDPLPGQFFWADGIEPLGDMPEEIRNRIAGRSWAEITLPDWAMMGTAPVVARGYFDPNAFRYYLPSLLVGVLRDIAYVDWALEAILPANRKRRPKGKWWQEFSEGISVKQRAAICAFLEGLRGLFWDRIGPAAQQSVVEAEAIWFGLENHNDSSS